MSRTVTPVRTLAVSNFKINLPGEAGLLSINIPANHFKTLAALLAYAGLLDGHKDVLGDASRWIIAPLTYQLKRDRYPAVTSKELAVKLCADRDVLEFYSTSTNYQGACAEPMRIVNRVDFTRMVGIHLGNLVNDAVLYNEWEIESWHADKRLCWFNNPELKEAVLYDTVSRNFVHIQDDDHPAIPEFALTCLGTAPVTDEITELFKTALRRIS